MALTTTGGQMRLTGIRTLNSVDIQFVPKELAIARTPNIGTLMVVGYNNPMHHYTGGATELSFDLDFHCDDENREDVIAKCKLIETWEYNDGFKFPPERVRLTFGRLMRPNEVWVVTKWTYKISMFDEAFGFLPKQAYGSITLQLSPSENIKIDDVKWKR